MKFLPTSPNEFASPFGKRFDVEFSRSRGVPTPLQQTTTTRASSSCSFPSWLKYTASRTRPEASTVISRTRARVVNCAPLATAFGQPRVIRDFPS